MKFNRNNQYEQTINDINNMKLLRIIKSSDIEISDDSLISSPFKLYDKESLLNEYDLLLNRIMDKIESQSIIIDNTQNDSVIKGKILLSIYKTINTDLRTNGQYYLMGNYHLLSFLNNNINNKYTNYYDNKLMFNFIINDDLENDIIIGNDDKINLIFDGEDNTSILIFNMENIEYFSKLKIENKIENKTEMTDIIDNNKIVVDPFEEDYVELTINDINDNIFIIKLNMDNLVDRDIRMFSEKIVKFLINKQPSYIVTCPLIFDLIKTQSFFNSTINNLYAENNTESLTNVGTFANIDIYIDKTLWDNKILLMNEDDAIFTIDIDLK